MRLYGYGPSPRHLSRTHVWTPVRTPTQKEITMRTVLTASFLTLAALVGPFTATYFLVCPHLFG